MQFISLQAVHLSIFSPDYSHYGHLSNICAEVDWIPCLKQGNCFTLSAIFGPVASRQTIFLTKCGYRRASERGRETASLEDCGSFFKPRWAVSSCLECGHVSQSRRDKYYNATCPDIWCGWRAGNHSATPTKNCASTCADAGGKPVPFRKSTPSVRT